MSEVAYEDISDRFLSACTQLKYGEIVALPEFSYFESMSAVELLDPRLDSGMALLSLPSPIVPASLSALQLQAFLDTNLIHLAQWMEGQSLPHTLYSSVFLHRPELLDSNPIIKAVIAFNIEISENLHKLISTTSCLREDDYAYAVVNFEVDVKETETLLVKAEKIAEEDHLPRIKLLRGIHSVVNNLIRPDGLLLAESFLAFTLKQYAVIKEKSEEDVSFLFDKNFCLNKLPHFSPNKLYDNKNYDFVRAIEKIGSFLKSIEYLIKLREINDLDELLEALSNLPSFDILSRTLFDSVLFTQDSSRILVFSKTPLSDLILRSMQKFGVDTDFLTLTEEFSYYLARVEIVFKEYILLRLKNKARQQRTLCKYLSDFNILVTEGHFLTEKAYGRTNPKPEKALLFQWIFQKTTKAMIEFLRYSFELQLYIDKDISMVIFYMDFLYGVIHSNLSTQAQYFNSKQSKKKKKKFDVKGNELELKFAFALQMLCRGIVRFYMLLNHFNNISLPDDLEAVRFKKRFRAFASVQMPQLLEYASYQSIKTVPTSVSFEKFAEASKECFDAARASLSEIETVKNIKSLLRVCVKNLLSLSKARKLGWKCKVKYDFAEDKVFPVILVDPLDP